MEMMKKPIITGKTYVNDTVSILIQVLLNTIIVFVATTFIENYFILPVGEIIVGEPIVNDQKIELPITINNYSKRTVKDLRLSLPPTLNDSNIISSNSLTITQIPSTTVTGGTIYSLSDIDATSVTSMLITSTDMNLINKVKFKNYSEKNLSLVSSSDQNEAPLSRSMKRMGIYAITFALINFISLFYLEKILAIERRKIAELEVKISESIEDGESLKSESKLVTARVDKLKLVMLKKITDLSNELDFWKNTIRKILYKCSDRKIDPEQLFDAVSESLETHSSKSSMKFSREYSDLFEKLFSKKPTQ